MTTEQLISDAMALPLSERVSLAQALWESIDAGLPHADENAAIADAVRRDAELSSGKVRGSDGRRGHSGCPTRAGMKVIFHPDAEAELIEAARYYESRVATLGAQFLAEANRAVGVILHSPNRWPVVDKTFAGV